MNGHRINAEDVRLKRPHSKGKIAGLPIQSYEDLCARLDKVYSSPRTWPVGNSDFMRLVPDMKDRMRGLAERTLVRSFVDFDNGLNWTQRMMPRSGRWKIAFPIIIDDRVFMRKVPISWDGALEIERFEELFGENRSGVKADVPVPKFRVDFDDDTGIAYADMLYVTPLTTEERDRKFEEIGKPSWSDVKHQREFGLDSNGMLVSFDPHG